jgi:copper chaperone
MLRLKVAGMTCDHCVRSVADAVHSVEPAAQVKVSLENSEVEVSGATKPEPVIAAIVDAGYDAEPLAA